MNFPSRTSWAPHFRSRRIRCCAGCGLRNQPAVIWLCFPVRKSKTIHFPSDDQRGVPAQPLSKEVRRCGSLPSALLFHIFAIACATRPKYDLAAIGRELRGIIFARGDHELFQRKNLAARIAARFACQAAGGKPEHSTNAKRSAVRRKRAHMGINRFSLNFAARCGDSPGPAISASISSQRRCIGHPSSTSKDREFRRYRGSPAGDSCPKAQSYRYRHSQG